MKKILIICVFVTGLILTLENRYYIQPDESELIWTGSKINGEHYGNIKFKAMAHFPNPLYKIARQP